MLNKKDNSDYGKGQRRIKKTAKSKARLGDNSFLEKKEQKHCKNLQIVGGTTFLITSQQNINKHNQNNTHTQPQNKQNKEGKRLFGGLVKLCCALLKIL